MAFTFMKKISPEYVIENAIKDVRTSGIEGLKPYLTENAEMKVEKIRSISSGMDILTGSNRISLLINRLADCEWTVIDILKGSESAKGIVAFKYITEEDDIEGSVELTMIKEDKEWKIDGVEMPKFEKFTVTRTGEVSVERTTVTDVQ